jgi:hypothetical protein
VAFDGLACFHDPSKSIGQTRGRAREGLKEGKMKPLEMRRTTTGAASSTQSMSTNVQNMPTYAAAQNISRERTKKEQRDPSIFLSLRKVQSEFVAEYADRCRSIGALPHASSTSQCSLNMLWPLRRAPCRLWLCPHAH